MADGVARSPSRLCSRDGSRDGKICCYGNATSTIFLLALVPCFLLSVFRFSFLSFPLLSLHPGMFIFLVSLRLCSIHLLLSASTDFIPGSTCSCCLCHLYPTLSRNCFVFLRFVFFVALISRVAFFCARVPGTLAIDLPSLILQRRLVFLSSNCLTT